MGSLKRSLKRLVRGLLDNGVSTLDETKLITDPNLVGRSARRFILDGTYEKPERDLVKQALAPGDRVIEFGGCLGLLSLLCAKIVGAQNVLCYEPNPIACDIIRRNYELNKLFPELRAKALTVDGGDVSFYQSDNLFSSSLYERNAPGAFITVPSDRFADVVREFQPTVLVVDIEGAECEVLPSSDLAGVKKIIIETHEKIVGREKNDELIGRLKSRDFSVSLEQSNRLYLFRES